MVGSRSQPHRVVPGARLRSALRWAVAVLIIACLPGQAHAAVGDGILVGGARLHLGAELLLKFDSQVGAGVYGGNAGSAFDQQNPPDGIGVVRGTLGLDGKGENYRLSLQTNFDWNQYAGFVANTRALSFFGANAAGSVIVNPNAPVGFELMGSFTRSDRTTNPLLGVGVLSLGGNVQARVRLRPWNGRFEFGFGGDLGGNAYTPQLTGGTNYGACNGSPTCDAGLAAAYNSLTYRAAIDAKWRLFPKTGFMFDANFGATDYSYGKNSKSYEFVQNHNALPYAVLLGFGSLLSTRVSFAIKGGYQGITYPDDVKRNVGGPIGLAEFGFRFSETSSGRVGYARTVQPVGGDEFWYGDHRIYVDMSLQPRRHLLLYGVMAVDLISYGTSARADTGFSGNVRAEYAFMPWLKLVGAVGAFARSVQNAPATAIASQAAYSFTRFDISLGVATLF